MTKVILLLDILYLFEFIKHYSHWPTLYHLFLTYSYYLVNYNSIFSKEKNYGQIAKGNGIIELNNHCVVDELKL